MPYYRSTAHTISQGFQKVLIYYFTNFLQFTMNFQSSCKIITNQSLRHYSIESQVLQKGPSLFSNSSAKPLVGKQSRGGTGRRRIRPERRQSMATSGGEGPWTLAHQRVASARTVVARRGLATRAGNDGRASAGGSSTRRCRQPEKRHYAHGETRGT